MGTLAYMIRRLTYQDIPAAFQLSYDAGWNQTLEDWRRLLKLEPDGCFGLDADGTLVATTALLCHGQHLAWLGMVLTHPDYRRRGFARRLVGNTLDFAGDLGIRCVKLDASDQGRPLYLDFGFEDEQPAERWHREPAPLELPPQPFSMNSSPLEPEDLALDKLAFGADRERFLTTLGQALRFDNGFLLHRNGSRAHHLGPCVARDPRDAASAIRAAIASSPTEPWFWDLLPQQTEAVRIARSLGFVPVRRLTRMRRGAPIAADDNLVYAVGGFETG